jgi:hypothetical protein
MKEYIIQWACKHRQKKGPCDRMNRPPGTNRTSTTYTTNNWQSRNNTYKSMRTRTNAHMNASHTQIRTCRNACTHTHTNTHTHARAKKKCNTQSQAQARTDDRRVMEASPEVVYADVATQARTGDRKVMGASPVVLSADVVTCCATPT